MQAAPLFTAFARGLWLADGPPIIGAAGFPLPTRMMVIGLPEGRLFVWSPIALSDELPAAVDALGQVACLIAPNCLHHSYMSDWVLAYPQARLG